MKEDILEQIVEDMFVAKTGCFVKHNVKFRPEKDDEDYISNQDSVHSDIDILAIDQTKDGYAKVNAVTCKSWQGGLNAKMWLEELEKDISQHEKKSYGREKWKYFRELVVPKWTKAYVDEIEKQTGTRKFTYVIACTKVVNNKSNEIEKIEQSEVFRNRFAKCGADVKIKVLTFREIVFDYFDRIDKKETNAVESTEIGRLLQLIYSSGIELKEGENRPTIAST